MDAVTTAQIEERLRDLLRSEFDDEIAAVLHKWREKEAELAALNENREVAHAVQNLATAKEFVAETRNRLEALTKDARRGLLSSHHMTIRLARERNVQAMHALRVASDALKFSKKLEATALATAKASFRLKQLKMRQQLARLTNKRKTDLSARKTAYRERISTMRQIMMQERRMQVCEAFLAVDEWPRLLSAGVPTSFVWNQNMPFHAWMQECEELRRWCSDDSFCECFEQTLTKVITTPLC